MKFARRLRNRIAGGLRALVAGAEEGDHLVAAAPPVGPREILRRFWPYVRPYRRRLPAILFFVALVPAIEAATIWTYKVLVDDVLIARQFDLLFYVLLAYLGLTLAEGVATFCDEYLSDWVGGKVIVDLRTALFAHLHGLSLGFFDRQQLGDTLSRLNDDVEEIEDLMLGGLTEAVSYGFQLVFFVGALFYLDWQLALISLFVAPLFWLVARHFSRKIKEATREERRRSGSTGAVAEESLSNAALVQAYNRQCTELARFRRENDGNFSAQMAATRLNALFSPLVNLIELTGVIVVVGFGAYGLSQGRLSVGGLLVFLVYLGQLYRPIRGLSGLLTSFYAASAGAERVIELLDQRPSVTEREDAVALPRAEGRLEFDAVSFAYPGKEGGTLKDVSFSVGPGETLALVGPSGSGKSTAAKLALRFYDPDRGAVRLDGHDLRDVTLGSLRDNVAVLLQEALVFDGTVRENIAYGRPGATEGEIEAAARAADADGFIRELPEGYDTVVGQKGRLLSGGQRQGIAIARAFVRDAPVLVLDEPTTGLDAASGGKVMGPLRELMSGRTTVVISHDLATVRGATEIVVFVEGHVAERGPHADLIREDGLYAGLHDLRGRDAAETADP